MKRSIYNMNKVDFLKEPMFFGAAQNLQRYDIMKYPLFDRQTQTMLSYYWRPEEISLLNDRSDYENLSPEQEHIFTSNLKYQALLDSVQGRGPVMALLPFCSIPELESTLITWDFFENIHSRAYTYMLQNIYPNPTEILDEVMTTPEILKRAASVTDNYNRFYEYSNRYALDLETDRIRLKELLYMTLIDIYILEGLRFYVSFACSFAFGELKIMEGSAKIISLIARDENVHLAVTQSILQNYRTKEGDAEMTEIMERLRPQVKESFVAAIAEEKEWAEYLFRDGSMIGLNVELLSQYVDYIADKRVSAIGLDGLIYDDVKRENPLPWTDHWLNSKGLQVAPQETEVEQYLIGGLKQDVGKDDFSDFEL